MLKKYIAYLKDNPEGYWFKRKIYGWGWTPATWQGWLVIVAYLAVLVILVNSADANLAPHAALKSILSPLIIATIILLLTCYRKGESPRWQWGIEEKK